MSDERDVVSRGVYEQVAWERDIAIQQLKELGYSLGEKINKLSDKQRISELEDVCASTNAQYEAFVDEVEQILIDCEPNDIGMEVALTRLRELVGLNPYKYRL